MECGNGAVIRTRSSRACTDLSSSRRFLAASPSRWFSTCILPRSRTWRNIEVARVRRPYGRRWTSAKATDSHSDGHLVGDKELPSCLRRAATCLAMPPLIVPTATCQPCHHEHGVASKSIDAKWVKHDRTLTQ